jgi:hypothetical protein
MRSLLRNVRAPWLAAWLATWLTALVSLAACGSSASVAPTATRTPIAWATAAPGTVLFASDWSKGLDGWQASAGWTVRDGMLEMDGQDNRTLTIPYQPTVRDYAVEFSVQVVNEPKDGGFFQLHAAATPPASGYRAEVYRILTSTPHINGDHPTAQVTIDPSEAQDPSSIHPIDYEPHNTMATYRVEVRENTVRFATEKATLSAAVASKVDPLSHGPLTIECGLAFLRFGPVRVVAL